MEEKERNTRSQEGPGLISFQPEFISDALLPDLPCRDGYEYNIRQAKLPDIPNLTSLHFLAFGSEIEQYIPNNPDGRAWMDEAFRVCLEPKFDSYFRTFVVTAQRFLTEQVGSEANAEAGEDEEIIAYTRYIIPTPEIWDIMYSYPKAFGEMDQKNIDRFLGSLEKQHADVMLSVGKPRGGHLWLENLATHPDHRGLGIGSKLVEFACQIADKLSVEVYLDASDLGIGLYERFGFKLVEGVGNRAVSAPMVRLQRE